MSTMATDPTYISIREAARLLGVHDNTMRRYADRGKVRVARLPSGVRRLVRDDVEALTPRGPDQAIPKSWLTIEDFENSGIFESDEEVDAFLAMTYAERARGR